LGDVAHALRRLGQIGKVGMTRASVLEQVLQGSGRRPSDQSRR
jgi:hypothetical protein